MMIEITNLLHSIPADLNGELIEALVDRRSLRIERIVSRGHSSPTDFWYDQEEHEWVLLLAGRARLRFAPDDSGVELGAGDSLTIPAHQRHRVEWTDPEQDTIWLAVFYR